MGNTKSTISIDLSQIPEFKATELSEHIAEYALAYLEQPGVREKYEEWKQRRTVMKGGDAERR
ncbi:MAG: hypothetical protein RSG53_07810 [Oscillospiraceae bacterium]